MNNLKLLEKYRKKLSVYFALFVLISFWITHAFFLVSEYIPNNIKLEKKLEKRLDWVKNILKNHEKYLEKINENDSTLVKVLEKTLENVTIYEWCNSWICEKIYLDNIQKSYKINLDDKFSNIDDYKYLVDYFIFNNKEYRIIIKNYNEYILLNFIKDYLYYIIFSIPFALFFYFIWYYYVGKNFKPIKETISWLEDFTSSINHEMKTPLAEIISTLSLAKKLKNYDEAIDQSLESSKKLNKIFDSMLGIVNIIDSTYKKERFDLVKELKVLIKEKSKKTENKRIVILKNISNKSYFIKENKEHFDMCIRNILSNAIKYSDKKWVIDVNFKDGVLEIRDYGIWISKKNLKNIFDRYFRENYIEEEWYWIGLSLVKKIVDINWWKIIIKSQKKKSITWVRGTTVKILF